MFDAVGVVVVLIALFGVAVVTLLVVAAVKAAKAVAKGIDRTEAQARRAVENVTLKAKTFTKPGPAGELASLRLGLRSSLGGTREVLERGLHADAQLGESLGLLARLEAHAAELDGELRMLEREPEPARITAKLPELRERAGRITGSAESLRWAAQDRAHRFAADELSRLSEEIATEAGALRHWDEGKPAAGGSSASASAGPSASQSAPPRAGLGSGSGRPSAEELLGLGEPLRNLAQRLRKPAPGSQGN
ncbi:hypothetical protein ACFYNO_10595 [Kitasatospora sp. NPDC006697]|uniref:hypothetical protein n=1 Tax=Kitasatospora sp. NPDC006697 TaxID=3364020 RepID=UPI0036A12ADF